MSGYAGLLFPGLGIPTRMTVPLHFPVSEVVLLRVLIATDCSISARSESSSVWAEIVITPRVKSTGHMADEFLSSNWASHESRLHLQQLTASIKPLNSQQPEDTGPAGLYLNNKSETRAQRYRGR